ncbi:MAG: hypothetical protein M3355_00650 [Actinomycetota bacterium]|nr:hypothetical protein [Actinomycetota bacterium]
MESTTSRSGVDLDAGRTRPGLALLLAVLSVPGSTLTWETLPGGGFLWGAPLAVAAIALGVQARRDPEGRGKALAAIAIGAAMLVMMLAWGIVESV